MLFRLAGWLAMMAVMDFGYDNCCLDECAGYAC